MTNEVEFRALVKIARASGFSKEYTIEKLAKLGNYPDVVDEIFDFEQKFVEKEVISKLGDVGFSNSILSDPNQICPDELDKMSISLITSLGKIK